MSRTKTKSDVKGSIAIERAIGTKERPADEELGFGRVFTDHMLLMEYEQGLGWIEPRIVPYRPLELDPAAAAFHYGQTMFEGLKAFRGHDDVVRLFRVHDHCRRLASGAPRLCMPVVDPRKLHDAIRSLVGLDADWAPRTRGTALYIRPTLIATEPFLGVRPSSRYLLYIILSPVGPYYPGGLHPLRIWIEGEYARAARGGLGAVKAGANYGASLLAAREAQENGYAQVLWQDAAGQGHLEEMGVMNLFVKIDDTLLTPPLSGTILPGVTRDSVLTLARAWGLDVREEPIKLDRLLDAHASGRLQEVFGCGTAAVIAPVGELGNTGRSLTVADGEVGPLSRRLYDAITAIQYAEAPDPYGWTEVVAS
ncbi:MAG: branched-chain amino acid aminotransferase [Acidobacteriota bacterium]